VTADGQTTYGLQIQPRMGFFTDTTVCIGCKACEVAIFRTEFGTVVIQDDVCNGCG
jgi:Fe-S-cluster-containing dehydrogenase component